MKVSFDFDDTILSYIWDEEDMSLQPAGINDSIISKIRSHVLSGDDVYIVTSRKYSDSSYREIQSTLKDASVLVGIEEIVHVGNWKADTLVRMGIELHYDDDPYEIKLIPSTIETILVPTLHGIE